jgi:catechol 2,3-dioxygenase-like lactoylglutathione lyase family enzyme
MAFWMSPKRTNTILYCDQWSETTVFYREQLNLPVIFANDWFVEFQLTDTSFMSLANAARTTIVAVAGQGVTLTWQVDDLAAVKSELAARGIETTPIKRKWGARVIYCFDPEGHRLEFWQPDGYDEETSQPLK